MIGGEEEKRERKTYDFEIVKWLFGFALPYKRVMVFSLVFMILTAGLELLVPYITKIAVDSYIFPAWREAKFSDDDKDGRFESSLKEKYPSSIIISLGGNSYLIDVSEVDEEDKNNLEKLGYVSQDKYTVVDPEQFKADRLDGIREIIRKHPDVFRSAGDVYFAEYSLLDNLSGKELNALRSKDIGRVGELALLLLLILFFVFVFTSIYTYLLNYSGQKIMHRIRVDLFSHVLSLPQPFFDKNPVGRLTTRVTNDVNAINEMYTSVLVQFFKDILVIIGVLAVMFHLNTNLTLLIIVLTLFVGVASALFRMKLKTVYRDLRRTIAKLNAFVQESVRGIVLIKLYLREKENLRRFDEVNGENYKANMDQLFAFATFRPIIEFISVFAIGVILWYGGLSVLNLELTLGALIAYLYYVRMLFRPILELAERYNIFQSAIAASENLYDLVNTMPEEREGKRKDKIDGKLEFRNVWFAYNGEEWVLKDVSFVIEPGETVALVGLTGSGKTTVVNLILRLYEIQKGEILFDGTDIREYSPEFLRANISAVFQDLFLFGKNVSDDATGNSDEFSRAIAANGFAKTNGSSISSGEKQLVSLEKAFSKDVKFLILDEATSHIDAEMELKVQEAVKKGSNERTTLIIAHRLSNVREADRIIVIHKGEIFEAGTHTELLMRKGIYYNLYKLQKETYRLPM